MKFSIILLLLVAPLPTLADSKTPDFNNPSEMARHYENRIAEREREQLGRIESIVVDME